MTSGRKYNLASLSISIEDNKLNVNCSVALPFLRLD